MSSSSAPDPTGESTGLLLRLSSDEGPGWEEQWRNHHVPETVSQSAGFRIEPGHELGPINHAAIYLTDVDSVTAAATRVSVPDEIVGTFIRIATAGDAQAGSQAGALLVFTDCTDPSETESFEAWYGEHLEHTVENVDFFAAAAYRALTGSDLPSQYLAIYETSSDDVGQVQTDLMNWWIGSGHESPKSMVFQARLRAHPID